MIYLFIHISVLLTIQELFKAKSCVFFLSQLEHFIEGGEGHIWKYNILRDKDTYMHFKSTKFKVFLITYKEFEPFSANVNTLYRTFLNSLGERLSSGCKID